MARADDDDAVARASGVCMRRVAIDFGSTGVRRAWFDDAEKLIIERATTADPLHQLREWFREGRAIGDDMTMRCSAPSHRSLPPAHWHEFARSSGFGAFRVLGNHPEESPALGVARQIMMARRTSPAAVIDAGASHVTLAVASARDDAAPLVETWQRQAFPVVTSSEVEHPVARLWDWMRRTGATAVPVTPIGGGAPVAAAMIAQTAAPLECVPVPRPADVATAGILFANIVRVFEAPLPPTAGDDEIHASLAGLMEQAFDAVTHEGYDLDDTTCVREVVLARADGEDERAIAAGMRIDAAALHAAHPAMMTESSTPIVFRAARVSAIIEPVKPSLASMLPPMQG